MAGEVVREVVQEEWAYVVGLLPSNLDELAGTTGALRRRRAIASAADLIRLVLAYATEDWSLRQTAAMSRAMGWQAMSDVAILNRLRACPEFLRQVVSAVLARRLDQGRRPALRVCLVDATTVSRPGSPGTDWRLHVVYDLFALQLRAVQITDSSGGETFSRIEPRGDEVFLGDRIYGTTPGLLHLLERGGTFIVRASPQQIRLKAPPGASLDVLAWLHGLADATASECGVGIGPRQTYWPLRLVAVRKSPPATAKAVQKARRDSQKKGHQVREETLIMAGYVVILTNCEPGVTAEQVLEAYRFRWQIELAFKRLKSLLHLDALRARDPDLAQTYLLGKILAALLAEDLLVRAGAFSPWGFVLVPTPA